MRAAVCDGDGSAVCARVGGLVLRARPKPETGNRASPCPSVWTACGFGAQAFSGASAFNANIGAWNTARVTDLSYVCAAPGLAARTTADALGRGFGAARSVVRGGTAAARARAHVLALACAGPWM
jgi:surface protein